VDTSIVERVGSVLVVSMGREVGIFVKLWYAKESRRVEENLCREDVPFYELLSVIKGSSLDT
jgi:hypothetical protein